MPLMGEGEGEREREREKKKGGGIARKTETLPIWLRMRGSLFLALSSLQHKSVHTKEWTKS